MQYISIFAFSQPYSHKWGEELKLLISKGDQKTLLAIAKNIFKSHSQEWGEALKLLIEKADQPVLETIKIYVPNNSELQAKKLSIEYIDIIRQSLNISDEQKRKLFLDEQLGPFQVGQKKKVVEALPNTNILTFDKSSEMQLKDGDKFKLGEG